MFSSDFFGEDVFWEESWADEFSQPPTIDVATNLRVRRVTCHGRGSFNHDPPIFDVTEGRRYDDGVGGHIDYDVPYKHENGRWTFDSSGTRWGFRFADWNGSIRIRSFGRRISCGFETNLPFTLGPQGYHSVGVFSVGTGFVEYDNRIDLPGYGPASEGPVSWPAPNYPPPLFPSPPVLEKKLAAGTTVDSFTEDTPNQWRLNVHGTLTPHVDDINFWQFVGESNAWTGDNAILPSAATYSTPWVQTQQLSLDDVGVVDLGGIRQLASAERTWIIQTVSDGLFEFSHTVELRERIESGQLVEYYQTVNLHVFAQVTIAMEFLGETLEFQLAGSWDWTPATGPFVFGTNAPQRLDIDDYHSRIGVEGLGATLPMRGQVHYDDPTLNPNTTRAIDTSRGMVRMAGTPDDLTYTWIGLTADTWGVYPPAGNYPWRDGISNNSSVLYRLYYGYHYVRVPPFADPEMGPEWAAQVKLAVIDYDDGQLISSLARHIRTNTLGASVTTQEHTWNPTSGPSTLNAYDFPLPDDYAYYLDTRALHEGTLVEVEPGVSTSLWTRYASVSMPLVDPNDPTEHPRALADAIYEPWYLYQIPFDVGMTPVDVARSMVNAFEVDEAWANAYSTYLNSHNRRIGNLRFAMTPTFNGPTITVPATHAFSTFDNAATWTLPGNAAFFLANPDLTSLGTALFNFGSWQFTNPSGTQRALFRYTGTFKPFWYRYLKFYFIGTEGQRYRFGLGRQNYGVTADYSWEYAWEVTAETTGLQSVEVDGMHPTHRATVLPSGNIYVEETTDQISLARFASATKLWVEVLDAGMVEVTQVEGILKTTGDREPILLWQGFQGTGSQTALATYEVASAPVATPTVMIYSANGAPSFALNASGNINSVWSAFRTLYGHGVGSNDTGAVISSVSPTLGNNPILNAEDLSHHRLTSTGSLGKEMTPGVAMQLRHRLRREMALGPPGYYGMGDPVSQVYGQTNILHAEIVLGGEIRTVVPSVSGVGIPAFLAYHQYDGSTASTALFNDDLAARHLLDYGVKLPLNNVTGLAEYSGSPASPVYTAQGNLLRAYWLGGTGFDYEAGAGGYAIDAGGNLMQGVALDAIPLWHLFRYSAGGEGIAALQDWLGRYYRAWADGGMVRVQRSHYELPPFDTSVLATPGTTDAHPRLALPWGERVRLIFGGSRSAGPVYDTESRNSGGTWSTPVERFADAKRPTIGADPVAGTVILAAYSGGSIVALREDAGDDALTSFGFQVGGADIAVADDSFEIQPALGHWWLACRLAGADNISLFRSVNRGTDWTLVATVLPGGRLPTLAVDQADRLLIAARVGTAIQAVMMEPGDTAPGDAWTFLDAAGVPLAAANAAFMVTFPAEAPGRAVLTWREDGDSEPSERVSKNRVRWEEAS